MMNYHIFCYGFILLITYSLCESSKLVFVQQVFRHGHRYPLFGSKIDHSDFIKDIKSVGQLTKQGKSMHYIFGQALYKEYWEKLFSGQPYYKSYNQSKFYVKSTNLNRTIQSAQSHLLGIFENLETLTINSSQIQHSLPLWPNITRKPGNVYQTTPLFNPVPIHIQKGFPTPWNKGDFLRMYAPQYCPSQKKWLQQNLNRQQIQKIVNNVGLQKAIDKVNKALNISIGFFQLYLYYDSAVCMRYDGRYVNPVWTEDFETKRALDAIEAMDILIKYFYTQEQLTATATGYFNQTFHNFKQITKDQTGVQWAIYSAHDTTIANYLARLNLTNPKCIFQSYLNNITKDIQSDTCIVQYPLYTSNIIFQVYKYENNNTFTMKIRYNGQYRKIPFCQWKEQCQLQYYYIWFESWKDINYVQSCGIINEQKQKSQYYFSVFVVQLGIIICFLISYLYKYLSSPQIKIQQEKEQNSD